jgi:RNA polymerase sigma-70 factor (ECF subfamily)
MGWQDTLAERFEAHRLHLRAVAYRMLGSEGEAEDAVQEAWLRLTRAEEGSIGNLGGWLTTVVARVCLDMLRSRKSRREEALDGHVPEAAAREELQPDAALRLADSVGLAMLVVLDALAPAERIAFVLHDLFDVPFDDIAPIVGRNPAATRQLASRARRRVQGARAANDNDRERQQRVVDAFLTAAREGDFDALLAALDPDVVLRADPLAIQTAAARAAQGEPAPALAPEVHGARAVAEGLRGRARGARPALVGGVPGAVWAPGGVPRAGFAFTFAGGRIAAIEIFMDPVRLRDLVEYDAQQS